MTTTILRFDIGDGTGGDWGIAHIRANSLLSRTQAKSRIYDEDGTALAAEDTTPDVVVTTPFVPVVLTQMISDAPSEAFTWYHRKIGDADSEIEELT